MDVKVEARLNELTAGEIVTAIAAGRTTCEAVVRACLDRIADRESTVQAWTHLDPDQALADARAFDRQPTPGPLAGVPFGVKDIIDTSDMPTEWGTPIHRGRRTARDAACVALTRRAGGVLMGKTVTTEFANLHPGKTRNPHDTARTPGGSSSGSAAAVADLMIPLALGTQTTGSTIRPASFCGAVGYRPTYGEHRLHGVMEASGSVDTLGILARSVDDVALYRDVLLGVEPQPVRDLAGPPRVGFCRTHNWDDLEATTQALLEDAVRALAAAGARVTEFDLPSEFGPLDEAHRWITSFEFVRSFAWEIDYRWDAISEILRQGRIADGLSCPLERYVEMQEFAANCRRRMDALCENYDVLLAPAALGEAPIGLPAFAGAPLYMMWTLLHVPAITLPVFRGPRGMPIGAQLLGKRHRDRCLFAHAKWVYAHL
jgi:amidase